MLKVVLPEKVSPTGVMKTMVIWEETIIRTAGINRTEELVKAAGVSIGRKVGLVAAEARRKTFVRALVMDAHQHRIIL